MNTQNQTTVVIPHYNGKSFIREALESVLSQSVAPVEILIVDDCSNDGSYEYVVSLVAQLSLPVKIIRTESNSGGPVYPMSLGIDLARTDFVTLFDQDDLMSPTRIETQTSALSRCPSAFACTGHLVKIDNRGDIIKDGFLAERTDLYRYLVEDLNGESQRFNRQRARNFVFKSGTLTIASHTTLRKSAWKNLGGFRTDLRIAWDFDFCLRGLDQYDLVTVHDIVGYYRLHSGNTSGDTYGCSKEILQCRMALLREPGVGLTAKEVQDQVAFDSYGLSFVSSSKGRHSEAIENATRSFRLKPSAKSIVAVNKALIKAILNSFWRRWI